MTRQVLLRIEPLVIAAAVAAAVSCVLIAAYLTTPIVPLVALFGFASAALALVRPLWTVYVAILLLPFESVSLPLGATGLGLAESMFAMGGAAWAAKRLVSAQRPWLASPLTVPLAVLVIAVALGLLTAAAPFEVVKRLVMWGLFFFTVQMVLAEGGRHTLRTMLLALAIAAGLEGLIAVTAGLGGPQFTLTSGGLGDRAQGTFDHPNTLGTFMAMGLPGAVALSIQGPLALRPFALGTVGALIAGLTLSLSRGGLIGAFGAVAVFVALPRFRRIALVGGVVGALMFGLLSTEAISPLRGNQQIAAFQKRLNERGASGKPDDRVRIWSKTPRMIADHPYFGVGAYNFREFAVRYGIINFDERVPYSHAHNVLLNVTAEMGFVGLAALIWVLIAIARVLRRAMSRRVGPDRAYGVAAAGLVLAVGLQGLVDDTIGVNSFTAATMAVVAGAAVLGRQETQ